MLHNSQMIATTSGASAFGETAAAANSLPVRLAHPPGIGRPRNEPLARGSKLPGHLSFCHAVQDLQNGAISVFGRRIADVTR